jgi:hypothetical protein
MAKPSTNYSVSKLDKNLDISANAESSLGDETRVLVDTGSNQTYNTKATTVLLQSVFDARLEYTGQTSGKQYTWNKAGDIREVDASDSEILLAKRIGGNGCCGSSRGGNMVFVQIFTGGK